MLKKKFFKKVKKSFKKCEKYFFEKSLKIVNKNKIKIYFFIKNLKSYVPFAPPYYLIF